MFYSEQRTTYTDTHTATHSHTHTATHTYWKDGPWSADRSIPALINGVYRDISLAVTLQKHRFSKCH